MIGLAAVLCLAALASWAGYSIPEDQLDVTKIFWGDSAAFENAAEVDVSEAIKSTPEYKEMQRKKIEPGTGKYWQLKSQASDRVIQCILQVAEENEYDLIVEMGYLGSLDPSIPSVDVTELVLEKVTE